MSESRDGRMDAPTSSPPRHLQPTRRRWIAFSAALCLLVAGCSRSSAEETTPEGSTGIAATSTNAPPTSPPIATNEAITVESADEGSSIQIEALAGDDQTVPPEAWTQLGGQFDITDTGEGPYTITISFADSDLPEGALEAESVFIAYFDETEDNWVPLVSEVDTTARTVSTSIDHLTRFRGFAISPREVIARIVDDLRTNLAEFDTGSKAASPTCPGGAAPRGFGVDVVYDQGFMDTSHVMARLCAGSADNEVVLFANNNRPFPLEINVPAQASGFQAPEPTTWGERWDAALARRLGGNAVLPTGRQAEIRLTFDEPATATTTFLVHGLAVASDVGFVAFRVLLDMANINLDELTPTVATEAFLDYFSCIELPVAADALQVVSRSVDCIDAAATSLALQGYTAAKAIATSDLLSAIGTAPELISLTESTISLANDLFSNNVKTEVVVAYQAPISQGCESLASAFSSAALGRSYNGWGPQNVHDLNAGERVTVAADFPVEQWEGTPPFIRLNVYDEMGHGPEGVSDFFSEESSFPGSVSWTVPATGTYDLEWFTFGNADWTVTCQPPE